MVLEQDYDVILMIQGQGYLLRSLQGNKMQKKTFLVLDYPWGIYIYIYTNFKVHIKKISLNSIFWHHLKVGNVYIKNLLGAVLAPLSFFSFLCNDIFDLLNKITNKARITIIFLEVFWIHTYLS